MDTMTFTKAAAGVLGAFLIYLLAIWASDVLYHTDTHGEQSYVIELDSAEEGAETAEVEEIGLEELLASADVGAGSKVFKKCSACHKLEAGANSTGPYLYGVVGRPIGTADGFGYSAALGGHGGDWTPEQLDEFLTRPSDYAPGTTMSFSGLKKPKDRANLIAYLDSLDK